MNILELPDEMLRMILDQVPNHLMIGQVCKRFYSVSCGLKSFHLTINSEEPEKWTLDSILCSERRISSINIYTDKELYSDRIAKVLESVGGNVKKAKVCAKTASVKGFQLLNLMPSVEQLELFISTVFAAIPFNFRLQLHKLKHLDLWGSPAEILEVFDRLPDDVLHSLIIGFSYNQSSRKYLGNQRNLKEIHIYGGELVLLDWSQVKLTTVKMEKADDLKHLRGQNEITKLSVFKNTEQRIVDFICSNLTTLTSLSLNFGGYFVDLSPLQYLRSLKTFESTLIVDIISTIKSKSLQEFETKLVGNGKLDEVFAQFGANCPNLRSLIMSTYSFCYDVRTTSEFDIGLALLHFPRLERIQVRDSEFIFNGEVDQHPLKYLELLDRCDLDVLMAVTACCKDLVTLSTDVKLNSEELKELLESAPNLKLLRWLKLQMKHFDTIKNFGANLETLNFYYTSFDSDPFYRDPKNPEGEWKGIKETLKQFDEFKIESTWIYDDDRKDFHCIATKTGGYPG
jgi:hypothetical protein